MKDAKTIWARPGDACSTCHQGFEFYAEHAPHDHLWQALRWIDAGARASVGGLPVSEADHVPNIGVRLTVLESAINIVHGNVLRILQAVDRPKKKKKKAKK